jgi:hypothetical protein
MNESPTAEAQRAQRDAVLFLPVRQPANRKGAPPKNHHLWREGADRRCGASARRADGFNFPPSQQIVKRTKPLCGPGASAVSLFFIMRRPS